MTFRLAIVSAIIALSTVLAATPHAWARGDLGRDRDACVLKVGPELMYFAGYQPNSSKHKFCEDVPQLGQTIFVFDYAEPELREMKADFRILRQAPGADETSDLGSATLAYIPPEVHPTGTLTFEHVFTEPGDYIGLLTVDGGKGEHWVSRFPFSVAKSHGDDTPYYLIAAAAALGLVLLVSNRRNRPRGRNGRLLRRG